jgi:hypothetical protein
MQFDEFDKKLKAAAEHHHPTYDERAWERMEKLLDKHLPVEKDRRRFLFILLLMLIGVGGAGILIVQPWKKNTGRDVSAVQKTQLSNPVTANLPAKAQETGNNIGSQSSDKEDIIGVTIETGTGNAPVIGNPVLSKRSVEKNVKRTMAEKIAAAEPKDQVYVVPDQKETPAAILSGNDNKSTDPFSLRKENPNSTGNQTGSVKNEQSTSHITSQKTSKGKRQHDFFISASAGPDMSFVEGNSGTVKLFGGAGLGYTYNNRVSLRTGFYSGRKVYTADADAYYPPSVFYTYYPYLEKIEADCQVYEIPVLLSYKFGKGNKRNFFASAGLSTYLMKEEKYEYYYKTTPTGPTLSRSYTLNNVNKHFFAGLTLSGGYTKDLSRHVSITAEPYIKLPLSGVGYGKVELNSAGVSFSMNVKPFIRKK